MFLDELRKENPTKTNPRGWLVLKRPEVAGFQAPGDFATEAQPSTGRVPASLRHPQSFRSSVNRNFLNRVGTECRRSFLTKS